MTQLALATFRIQVSVEVSGSLMTLEVMMRLFTFAVIAMIPPEGP